jgi:hypothetical protein
MVDDPALRGATSIDAPRTAAAAYTYERRKLRRSPRFFLDRIVVSLAPSWSVDPS